MEAASRWSPAGSRPLENGAGLPPQQEPPGRGSQLQDPHLPALLADRQHRQLPPRAGAACTISGVAASCSSSSLNTTPSMRLTDLENPYSMQPQLSPTLTEAMRSLTRLLALKRSCPGRAARGATVTTRMPGGVPSASASADKLGGCSLALSSRLLQGVG